MGYSRLLPVRQHFPDRAVKDIAGAIARELAASGMAEQLNPGAEIAIGVGSRGIAHLPVIVRAVVDYWKSRGCRPFIFPAMGSHGAATAEGQADVIAHFGVHEASMGCPVVSQLEVVPLGKTDDGIEALMDRTAFAADGIFLINRVKWHTDFAGKIESGLFKMMAIGLGKLAGAQTYHTFGFRLGLEHVIRTVGRQMLTSGKVLGGLAVLEDANHHTAQLTVIPAAEMERKEEEILALAKSWMGRIPVDALDFLIIDEIGKNFSGSGMDTKVVNRSCDRDYNPWDTAPPIERIFVRSLSEHSYGNAIGVGLADVVLDRILEQIDWNPTYINALTASTPVRAGTPMHFPTDRECIERIWPTTGRLAEGEVTFAWIANTMELGYLKLSENLRTQIERNPMLEIVGDAEEWEFDERGNLAGLCETEAVKR